MDLERVKNTGITAAYHGAEALKRCFGNISGIEKKGDIDLVTEADKASEQCILETIQGVFPEHTILAEESGLQKGSSDLCWIIDPLDGTTNFAHELDLFAVSIAFDVEGQTVFGIVFNPIRQECFIAVRDCGAELNGRPIHVSPTETVLESLLVTGFPYDKKKRLDPLMARFRKCMGSAQGLRRLGSAALDLCYVACGRFEGFWEENLKPWDTAAGALIAREAGAVITDFSNLPFSIEKKEILATNGLIHNEMLRLLEL